MTATTALTLLIIIPIAASPLIYMVGRLSLPRYKRKSPNSPSRWLALIALLIDGIPLYYVMQHFNEHGPIESSVNGILVSMDGIGLVMAVAVWVLGTLVLLFSYKYMANETNEEKYYALLIAMIGTIMGLGCAADLFNLWVWFEAMAIASYMLVSFYRKQPASLEAGVKYLVQSATGSALVLFGIALTYMASGTTSLNAIRSAAGSSPLLIACGALFVIGFGVKTALVPLHTWLPDAHSQAPSGISAMLSGIVIEAGLIAMLRSLSVICLSCTDWGIFIMVFAALNMLVGNLMALRQNQVKRLLAYSSVTHMGYMLLGIGIAASTGIENGAIGAFFHLFNHMLMKGLAFLSAGALLFALHIARKDHGPLVLNDLNGVSKRYPLTAFCFSVALLALGGLPPLAGFMSKWQIFVAGAQTQNTMIIILVIFAALNSVLSLGYYAPLVNRIYRKQPSDIISEGKDLKLSMTVPLIVMTLAIAVIGFYPTLMSWLTQPAGSALLIMFK